LNSRDFRGYYICIKRFICFQFIEKGETYSNIPYEYGLNIIKYVRTHLATTLDIFVPYKQ
jgi:hypothetical protein